MTNEKVFAMSFAKVYPMLIAKAERKGRSRDEVQKVTAWLTGYTDGQLEELLVSDITYGDFFRNAPALNPARKQIKCPGCSCSGWEEDTPLHSGGRLWCSVRCPQMPIGTFSAPRERQWGR